MVYSYHFDAELHRETLDPLFFAFGGSRSQTINHILRDETDYPGTVDLTLLTEQQPVPTADGFAVGTLGGIRFDPDAATAAVTAVPISDPRLRTAWPETIYKITLHFQKMLKLELY